MKWFRKHAKHGSRLALFALLVQFALSFGHFHHSAVQAAPAIETGLTDADLALNTDAARDKAHETTRQPQRPDHDGDEQPAELCAICAVTALAGSALFAIPPALPLPQAAALPYLVTDAEFVNSNPAHRAFQSRAPPLS